MPINQDKYIKINSEIVVGSSARSFCGLVLTTSEAISEATRMGITDVIDTFGEESDEARFASRYFSFSGANGRKATEIMFAPYTAGSELEGLKAVLEGDDINFGSFTFLQSLALSVDKIKAIASFNDGLGRKYMFIQPVTASTYTAVSSAIDGKTILTLSADINTAYIVQSILATTDFSSANGTRTYAFKSLPNEDALVTTDALYEALKAKNVNFYGATHDYPNRRAFYNLGVCSDGTDIGVLANEIWLESEIIRGWFDLVTSVNKIPSDNSGIAMIRAMITDAIDKAISNGTIASNVEISDYVKVEILNRTGSAEAVESISSNGYWLNVWIENNEGKYTLVYRKGDAIKFLEGSHSLI